MGMLIGGRWQVAKSQNGSSETSADIDRGGVGHVSFWPAQSKADIRKFLTKTSGIWHLIFIDWHTLGEGEMYVICGGHLMRIEYDFSNDFAALYGHQAVLRRAASQ